MPTLIAQPTRITAAGNKPKLIDEYIGRVNSETTSTSVAHMRSPSGWIEPGQTPEFDEFTIVLRGTLHVKTKDGELDVNAGRRSAIGGCGVEQAAVLQAEVRRAYFVPHIRSGANLADNSFIAV